MVVRYEHLISVALQTSILLLLLEVCITSRQFYDWFNTPEDVDTDATSTRRRWCLYIGIVGSLRTLVVFLVLLWDRPLFEHEGTENAFHGTRHSDVSYEHLNGGARIKCAPTLRHICAWVFCLHCRTDARRLSAGEDTRLVVNNHTSSPLTYPFCITTTEAHRMRNEFVWRWQWSQRTAICLNMSMLLVPSWFSLACVTIIVVLQVYVLDTLGRAAASNSAWFTAAPDNAPLHRGFHIDDIQLASVSLYKRILFVLISMVLVVFFVLVPLSYHTTADLLFEPTRSQYLRDMAWQSTAHFTNEHHTEPWQATNHAQREKNETRNATGKSVGGGDETTKTETTLSQKQKLAKGVLTGPIWVVVWDGLPCGFEEIQFKETCPSEYTAWANDKHARSPPTPKDMTKAARRQSINAKILPWPVPKWQSCLRVADGTSGSVSSWQTLLSGMPMWATGRGVFANDKTTPTSQHPFSSTSQWGDSDDVLSSVRVRSIPLVLKGPDVLMSIDELWTREYEWLLSRTRKKPVSVNDTPFTAPLLVTRVRVQSLCTTLPHLFHRLNWLTAIAADTTKPFTLVLTSSHGQLTQWAATDSVPPAASYGGGDRDATHVPYWWWTTDEWVADRLNLLEDDPPPRDSVRNGHGCYVHQVRATVDWMRGTGLPRDTLGSRCWPLAAGADLLAAEDLQRRCLLLREVMMSHGVELMEVPTTEACRIATAATTTTTSAHRRDTPMLQNTNNDDNDDVVMLREVVAQLEQNWSLDKDTQIWTQTIRNLLIVAALAGVWITTVLYALNTASLASPCVGVGWLCTSLRCCRDVCHRPLQGLDAEGCGGDAPPGASPSEQPPVVLPLEGSESSEHDTTSNTALCHEWITTHRVHAHRTKEMVRLAHPSRHTSSVMILRYNNHALALAVATGAVPTMLSLLGVWVVYRLLGWEIVDASVLEYEAGTSSSPSPSAYVLQFLVVRTLPLVVYAVCSLLFRAVEWRARLHRYRDLMTPDVQKNTTNRLSRIVLHADAVAHEDNSDAHESSVSTHNHNKTCYEFSIWDLLPNVCVTELMRHIRPINDDTVHLRGNVHRSSADVETYRYGTPLPSGNQPEHPCDVTMTDAVLALLLPYKALAVVVLFLLNLTVHAGVSSAVPWVWPSWFLQRTHTRQSLAAWTCFVMWCFLPWCLEVLCELWLCAGRAPPPTRTIEGQHQRAVLKTLYEDKATYIFLHGHWSMIHHRLVRLIHSSVQPTSHYWSSPTSSNSEQTNAASAMMRTRRKKTTHVA